MPKFTAEQKMYLRRYGTLPDAQATTLEQIMYRCCVQYRLMKFYQETERDVLHMMRVMVRSFAVALVWKQNPGEPVSERAVKAIELEFMRRAKEDPPF